MQNLFFLVIISVGKEKIQNKNNTKTKTIEVSHFAVETAGTGVREGTAGLAAGGPTDLPQGRSRAEPRQRGGWPGAQAAAGGQKGKRVQGFSAVENSEKTKIGTHAVSSSPTNFISKMCSGASKVLATSFISLFTPKLSLKLRTQRNEA